MLARNRFNRVHVVFQADRGAVPFPQFLSHTAAEYGIDFTLGVGGDISAEELAHVLILCPAIRGVALEGSDAQAAVFSALRVAGRRVTLDLDGATAEPAVLQEALAERNSGIASGGGVAAELRSGAAHRCGGRGGASVVL